MIKALCNDLSKKILHEKYMVEGEKTPEDVFMRVAKVCSIPDVIDLIINDTNTPQIYNIAEPLSGFRQYRKLADKVWQRRSEAKIKTSSFTATRVKELWKQETDKYYKEMCELNFMPASPILMNSGNFGMLSSCFFLRVEDSMDGIFDAVKRVGIISKAGGGVGLDFSLLRPEGSKIKGTGGTSSGPISFMKVFNATGETVKQGGRRKGALLASLRIDHPDIIKFIKCKEIEGKLNNFNISVLVTDEFMKDLKEKPQKTFWAKFNNQIFYISKKTDNGILDEKAALDPESYYKVAEIWGLICKNALFGEPGCVFIDTVNRADPLKGKYGTLGQNACSELHLVNYDSCNLVSINLATCVNEAQNDLDYPKLEKLVRLGIRFLDNVIDLNNYPLPETEKISLKLRRLGLGVFGLHDCLLKLKVRYGSEACMSFIHGIWSSMQAWAHDESQKLEEIRGVFPAFEDIVGSPKPWYNRRNIGLLTCMPTGTTSFIANQASSGIEPVFQWEYKRKDSYGEHTIRHWLLDEYKDLPKFAKTALEITPEEHVKVQATIQEYIDSGISKCLAKGTLIPTNKGIIPIENIGNARGNDVFSLMKKDIKVLGNDKQWHRIINHYSGGIKPIKEVHLENGVIINGTHEHKVMTRFGWKALKDLKIKDYILSIKKDFIFSNGKNKLPKLGKLRSNANKIKVPMYMSNKLAKFFGMLASDGATQESTGFVGLFEKNKYVGEVFDKLAYDIFNIMPSITQDKRTKVIVHYITSRALCRWVEKLLGKGAKNKKVPDPILKGNKEEILSFVKGLTLDGYNAQNRLVVYEGKSKNIADGICALLHQCGYAPYQGKKYVKGYNYYIYGVRIYNFTGIEKHKKSNIEIGKRGRFVKVPADYVNRIKTLPAKHPSYSSLRSIWQNKRFVAYQTTLDKLGINYDPEEYYVRVSKIIDSKVPVYDLEVEDDHTYIVNGVVSHNTVNMPNNATVEDVDKVFKLAYALSCKSITVYRTGSRKEEVLVKDNKLDQNPPLEQEVKQPDLVKEEKLNKDDWRQSKIRKRPKVLFGATIKINTSSGPAYITLNEDVEGLRECLISASKAGSEVGVHTAVEGRLISNSLQYRVPIESIVQHLKNQKSSPIWESGEMVKSLPDAIAKAIEFYRKNYEGFSEYLPDDVIEAIKEEKAFDEPSGELCPECGENLYMEGGCNICKACGYSTCG